MSAVLSIQAAAAETASRFEDFSLTIDLPRAGSRTKRSTDRNGETLNEVNEDPVKRNKLINDNNLLKGVVMTSNGPVSSSRQLIERPSTLRCIIDNSATIETTSVEAQFTKQLMESNYNSVSVKVSAPYITATADYSESSSWKETETEKTVYMSSRYLFPQGRIDFSEPGSGFTGAVKLSSGFTTAIQQALSKATLSDKRVALYNVFNEYGHVFRTKVNIGGALSAHTQETFSRREKETEVKQDIKAGLEGAVKNWGGGITVGHGNTSGTITTKENRKLDTKYIVNGGDYTKVQNTAEWIASTDQSEHWRVVQVSEVVLVADMLPEPTKTQVKKLILPLLGKWVDAEKVPGLDNLPLLIYRPKNPIPSGWYWLGHTADSKQALIVKPTLPLKAGRNPALTAGHESSGFTEQPFVDLPRYQFLSTYFGSFVGNKVPGSLLRGLRPDLGLPGRYELHGDSIATAIYITLPVNAAYPDDECLDLQSVVRVKLPGSENPPKPTWALKKSAVLFDSVARSD